MTQGNIERYHRSLKNRILLENSYLPGQLEARLAEFVEFYNNRPYHESLGNLTPADIYFGRALNILARRQNIEHQTINYDDGSISERPPEPQPDDSILSYLQSRVV
jgi:hypothetical protein